MSVAAQVQIDLRVPKNNTCRFKVHRFRDSGFVYAPRDEKGKPNKAVRTLFGTQHCADPKCAAERLTR